MQQRPDKGSNSDFQEYLRLWYGSGAGQAFARSVGHALHPWLQGIFGYHAVQVGALPGVSLLEGARINHRIVTDEGPLGDVVCRAEALPFAADSVDLLLMPHGLEVAGDVHAVLREAERVLVPEGYLILLGLDAWTVWGVVQRLRGRRYPLHSQGRIRDWLQVLGFDLQQRQLLPMFHYDMPDWLYRWPKTQYLAGLLSSNLAGGYLVLAQKRVTTLTPIKARWRTPPRLIAGGLAEPAARDARRHVPGD